VHFTQIMRDLLLISFKIAKEYTYNLLFYNKIIDYNIFISLDFNLLLNLSQIFFYNVVVLITS